MARSRSGALFIFAGAVAGAVSANIFIDGVGSAAVDGAPGWRVWNETAAAGSDPYALAHFLLLGEVPPASPQAAEFFTSRDSIGEHISASCTYEISGPPPEVRWWSLVAEPTNGGGGRTGFQSDNAVVEASGQLVIRASLHPQPGNWLKPPDAGALTFRLVVAAPASGPARDAEPRFTVKRTDC